MSVKKQEFDITGMHCAACVKRVENVVSKVDGVESVKVNLLTRKGSVEYKDGATVDSQQIIDAITNIGFGAAEADETKQEIEKVMRDADDRFRNQLVIDENGYVKVIQDDNIGHLFPVRHEPWEAGNNYVGKYSDLSTLDDQYISSLQGWLLYLQTGRKQYIDYVWENVDEEGILAKIGGYY